MARTTQVYSTQGSMMPECLVSALFGLAEKQKYMNYNNRNIHQICVQNRKRIKESGKPTYSMSISLDWYMLTTIDAHREE